MGDDYIECSICESSTRHYIKLLDKYICERCEKEIANITCEDMGYEYYILVIKNIWRDYLINLG